MPEPIPLALRHQIVTRHLHGESLAAIARDLGRSESGIRKIYRRYRRGGLDALKLDYHRCGPQTRTTDPLIVRAALWLKRRHPAWGAPYVRLQWVERYGAARLPTARTRLEVYPDLEHNPRRFTEQGFAYERVVQYLAEGSYVHKVSSAGQITLYGHRHQVGVPYQGQTVRVEFDAQTKHWQVYD